jgi:hypothetical protein
MPAPGVGERRAANPSSLRWFAIAYIPLAIAAAVFSFLPLYQDVTVSFDDGTSLVDEYGSAWDMASRPAGGPAVFGLILLFAFAGLSLLAIWKPMARGIPRTLMGLSVAILLLVVLRPGTGSPKPALAGTAYSGVALCIMAVVVAAVHLLVLGPAPADSTAPPSPPSW